MTVYFIGPESAVYHTDRDCPLLNNAYRYWSVQRAESPPPSRAAGQRGRTRRLCKRCAKAKAQ